MSEISNLHSEIEELAAWHEHRSIMAKIDRPDDGSADPVKDKAMYIHRDAARRLRALLAATAEERYDEVAAKVWDEGRSAGFEAHAGLGNRANPYRGN